MVGHVWSCTVLYGLVRYGLLMSCMFFCGPVCMCILVLSSMIPYFFTVMYSSIFSFVVLCGHVWSSMVLCGLVQSGMVMYALVYLYMFLFGPP